MKRIIFVLTTCLLLTSIWPGHSLAEKIYWTAGNKIQRGNLDGTGIEDLVVVDFAGYSGIALDLDVGKMYWAYSATDRILRADLDGSQIDRTSF